MIYKNKHGSKIFTGSKSDIYVPYRHVQAGEARFNLLGDDRIEYLTQNKTVTEGTVIYDLYVGTETYYGFISDYLGSAGSVTPSTWNGISFNVIAAVKGVFTDFDPSTPGSTTTWTFEVGLSAELPQNFFTSVATSLGTFTTANVASFSASSSTSYWIWFINNGDGPAGTWDGNFTQTVTFS